MHFTVKRITNAGSYVEFTSWIFKCNIKIILGVQKTLFSKVKIIGGRRVRNKDYLLISYHF
jgi:hypothetical protein